MLLSATITLNLNLQNNSSNEKAWNITLENVEALASTEESNQSCYYYGSLDCPKSPVKVLYIK